MTDEACLLTFTLSLLCSFICTRSSAYGSILSTRSTVSSHRSLHVGCNRRAVKCTLTAPVSSRQISIMLSINTARSIGSLHALFHFLLVMTASLLAAFGAAMKQGPHIITYLLAGASSNGSRDTA